MSIAQFVPIFLVLLLILLQKANLRIIYKNGITLRISLTIFALTLSDHDDKNLSLNKTLRIAKILPLLLKSARFALRRSDVRVLDLPRTDSLSITNILFVSIPIFISTSSVLAYISANAMSCRIPSHDVDIITEETSTLDILFKTRVIYLIISSLLFLYYIMKRKIRRAIKSV